MLCEHVGHSKLRSKALQHDDVALRGVGVEVHSAHNKQLCNNRGKSHRNDAKLQARRTLLEMRSRSKATTIGFA